jgi:hypothetical protein
MHDVECCPEMEPEINVFSVAWPRFATVYKLLVTVAPVPYL